MVMTLMVTETGCIHFVKRPGAVLVPGGVVARMTLDDPSSILLVRPTAPHTRTVEFHYEKKSLTFMLLTSKKKFTLYIIISTEYEDNPPIKNK